MHRIGPCRIEAVVSKGKAGLLVYKGFHEGLNRPALIRTLGAADPEERGRMRLDAQAQLCLRHPGIARLYELIEEQGQVFAASEFVDGTSLDSLLQETRFSWNEALALFQQVLGALEHAHRSGVIHRDIQPANVRISGGQVKLTDFALGAAGNPAYLSPEQCLSAEIDPRTDIYSSAVVLYEMLAGRPPFQGETDLELIQGHLSQIPAPLKELAPDLPAGTSAAVAIAIQKDPRQRFQSAADFLRALQEGGAGFLPAAPQAPPTPHPPAAPALEEPEAPAVQAPPVPGRGWQRRRRLVAAIWIVLGLDLAGSYGLWKRWDRPPQPDPSATPSPVPPPSTPEPVETAAEEIPEKRPKEVPDEVPDSPDPEDPVSSKRGSVEPSPIREERATPSPVIVKADPGPDPEEMRRREVDRLRDEIRQRIEQAEADLREQKLDAAQEELDQLVSQAQRHPVDLAEEIAKIRDLRKGVMEALVAAQEGERRLQQIRKLMEQGKYPEADNLARDLADETGVSEAIAAQARELSAQAKAELKKIFGDTQLGPTQNKVRKPPNRQERKMEP